MRKVNFHNSPQTDIKAAKKAFNSLSKDFINHDDIVVKNCANLEKRTFLIIKCRPPFFFLFTMKWFHLRCFLPFLRRSLDVKQKKYPPFNRSIAS